jgi:hypothetical protein
MDRDTTLNLLTLALRHVVEVERHIAQQHEIITSLERNDLDTSQVRVALLRVEELHDMLVADRDRLEKELAAFMTGPADIPRRQTPALGRS